MDRVARTVAAVRKIAHHFHKSPQSQNAVAKLQKDNGVKHPLHVLMDNATRWSSTRKMLDRFLHLFFHIHKMAVETQNQKILPYLPSDANQAAWLGGIREMLNIFEPLSTLVEKSQGISCSMSAVVETVFQIVEDKDSSPFKDREEDSDRVLEMKRLIRAKFGKYYGDVGVREFMGVCVFFDPRYSKVGITGNVVIRQ